MKLTKYSHACIVLEEQGKRLVIDPGVFTPEFGGTQNVVAVVVTHEHTDHFGAGHLEAILQANPEAKIFTTAEVKSQFDKPTVVAVNAGQEETVGPFRLAFSGDMHASAHPSLPAPHNTAVMVNDSFFYPGDSFTKPSKPIDVLAVPCNAPWAQVGQSMDYIAEVKAKRCVPTHDGLLSDAGHLVYTGILEVSTKANNAELLRLKPGDSIEI